MNAAPVGPTPPGGAGPLAETAAGCVGSFAIAEPPTRLQRRPASLPCCGDTCVRRADPPCFLAGDHTALCSPAVVLRDCFYTSPDTTELSLTVGLAVKHCSARRSSVSRRRSGRPIRSLTVVTTKCALRAFARATCEPRKSGVLCFARYQGFPMFPRNLAHAGVGI